MSARPKMPECFSRLSFDERRERIYKAPLGKTDRTIAAMYYLDEFAQIDIAAEVNMDRSAVSRRLPRIRSIIDEL